MQKKIFIILVQTLFLGSLCGAGEKEHMRTIVATFYPIRLALMNIVSGVEGIRVIALADSATGCLHDYQLTTRDMATLSTAEVLVVNGAGLEAFLENCGSRRPGLKIIDASAGINLLVSGGGTNAHIWVSPSRHIMQIQRIADGLAGWDPVHADLYQKNASAYIARLEALKRKMDLKLQQIRSREIITFHEAFPYFADEFKLKVVGVIEREPGSAPSAAEMASLIQLVRTTGVKTLFVEPQYPAKVATAISRETGAGLFTLDPVVSGPNSTNAYITIMERNLVELERGLR
ncbi:MAG: metal ABC transporter substrate-binding protein [bacterium]